MPATMLEFAENPDLGRLARMCPDSVEKSANDYNLLRGGLLPIGLLVLTAAPLIAAEIRDVL
jgi:hypothetical protein